MGLYVLIILLSQLKIRKNTIQEPKSGKNSYWEKKQSYAKDHPDREYD